MRKSTLIISLFLSVSIAHAQRDTVKLREIQNNIKEIITDRPPQAVYFQIGGSGPFLSVNYDRRFSKRVNGAGFTAGLGFYSIFGVSVFSIPLSVNYLIGKSSSFVELAGGTTFLTGNTDLFDNSNGSGFIEHLNLGYRYQPTRGGFFFRGGISPLFGFGETITSYYVGFGHNF